MIINESNMEEKDIEEKSVRIKSSFEENSDNNMK